MKATNKILATILSVIIGFTTLSMPVRAENKPEPSANSTVLSETFNDTPEQQPKIIEEEISLRSEDVKHFRCDNGSFIAASYPYPVHYEQDGEWKDIDNSLIAMPQTRDSAEQNSTAGSPAYVNKDAPFEVGLPSQLSDNTGISIEAGGIPLRIGMDCGQSDTGAVTAVPSVQARGIKDTAAENESFLRLEKSTSSITYANAYPNTDIEYVLTPAGIKENIIVKSAQESYEYIYNLSGDGLTFILNPDNSVSAYSANGDLAYTVESPYMFDTAGEESESITVTLKQGEDGYKLTYLPDANWINAAERQFPVTVDPSIKVDLTRKQIHDVSVNSKEPTTSAPNYKYLTLGQSTLGMDRIYLRFDVPALPDCSVINYASCNLAVYETDYRTTDKNYYTYAYEVGRDWKTGESTDSGTGSQVTWNGQAGWTFGNALDYTLLANKSKGEWMSWNITPAVKKWYEGGVNTGIVIKTDIEGQKTAGNTPLIKRYAFYSSENTQVTDAGLPTLTVGYMNNAGLENYWDYHTVDNGRAGLTSVNDYNGNLVHAHTDITMNGNRLPISLSHVYNLDKGNSSGEYLGMNIGYVWRLNVIDRLMDLDSNSNAYASLSKDYQYRYIDPDGTVKYFKKSATDDHKYEFDDSLILSFIPNSPFEARCILKDESGSKKYYDYNGYLRKIEDQNGNIQTIHYDNNTDSRKIIDIQDPVGRKVTFQYSGSSLISITDPSGRKTLFGYADKTIAGVTRKLLTQITYPDQKKTAYEYDAAGNLTKITDCTGMRSEITYKSTTVPGKTCYRTSGIKFFGTGNGVQNGYTFQYQPSQTVVSDLYNRSETVMFDSVGRTVCVKDDDGRAYYGQYNSTGNQNNKLKYQSDMQHTVDNLAKNNGYEYLDSYNPWYVNGLGDPQGSVYITSLDKLSGTRSMAVINNIPTGRINARQDLTIIPGKTYTLSAYIKTSGVLSGTGGAFLGLVYQDNNGNYNYAKSDIVKETEGWERFSVTFSYPSNYSNLCSIMAGIDNAQGSVWIDNFQLEEGATANRYNYLQNSDMNGIANGLPDCWATSGCDASDGVAQGRSGNGFKLTGSPEKVKELYQELEMSGTKGDTIVAGAWAKSNSLMMDPDDTSQKNCALAIKLYYNQPIDSKGTKESTDYFYFDSLATDWQYMVKPATAQGDYYKVSISLLYQKNMNTVVFDDAQLYIDNYGVKYEYDDKGNLISKKDKAGQEYKYTYTGPDLTKMEFKVGGVTKSQENYVYDSKHNPIKKTSDAGVITEYTYGANGVNTYGNVTKVTVKNADGSLQTSQSCTYTPDYNYKASLTDARGRTVSYDYDTTKGLLRKTTDSSSKNIYYTYDPNTDEVLKQSSTAKYMASSQEVSVESEIQNGKVSSIKHNNFLYGFTYDQYGRQTSTNAGSHVLTQTAYNANGTLQRTTYGNGDYVEPEYNSVDEIVAEKYNNVNKYQWDYGTNGLVGRHTDIENDVTYRYEYDMSDRLRITYGSNGTKFRNLYDDKGNIYNTLYTFNENTYIKKFSNNYIYSDDNRISQVHFNQNGMDINRVYDDIGRVTSRKLQQGSNPAVFTTSFSYLAGANGNATGLLESVNNNGNQIQYKYNDKGLIQSVSEGGSLKISYIYDSMNQLIEETNRYAEKKYTYTYDAGGNLASKAEYRLVYGLPISNIPTHTYNYAYGDATWKDLLTSYDGKPITYDECGNPTSYNGDAYSWTGRRLDSIANTSRTAEYKYNSNGIRTQKTINGATSKYYLKGDRIVLEKDADEERTFWYDGDGNPAAFNVYSQATGGAAATYYYMYNGQGDVIGLYDGTGAIVAKYVYDSWGKLLKITDGAGNDKTADTSFIGYKNPIRYRGYYYDNESGLYYLKNRYYNPEICRFINADSYISADTGILGTNMFAYCNNNPVIFADHGGQFLNCIFGAITGAVSAAICGGDVLAGAAGGAIAGLSIDIAIAMVTPVGAVTAGVVVAACAVATIGGAVGNFASQAIPQIGTGKLEINVPRMVTSGIMNLAAFGGSYAIGVNSTCGLPSDGNFWSRLMADVNVWEAAASGTLQDFCVNAINSANVAFHFSLVGTLADMIVEQVTSSSANYPPHVVESIKKQTAAIDEDIKWKRYYSERYFFCGW